MGWGVCWKYREMKRVYSPLLAFSDFVFDPVTGELTKNGHRLRMGKQVSDLLLILLAHPGELVTREQIRSILWPQHDQIDFEKVINNGISHLRFLLKDDPKDPRYIERIPKRGYRFLAVVEQIHRRREEVDPANFGLTNAESMPAAFPLQPSQVPPQGPGASSISIPLPRQYRRTFLLPILLLSGIILLAGLVTLIHSRSAMAPERGTTETVSLELVPIEADSPDLKPLAASFQLDLLDALSQLPQVRVKERHLSPNSSRDTASISRSSQDFQTILYGRLFRTQKICHLEFELVRASDGTHLASFQYNGAESEFALIREKLQRDVFLRLKLARQHGLQSPAGTSNQDAYNEYLQARLHFLQQTNESMREAVNEYRSAISKDRNFAAAYAGLAGTLFVMGERGILPQREAFNQSSDAVTIALRLDPASAEVHGVSGLIHSYWDWDLPAGERELRQAIQIDPTQAIYHQWLAVVLSIEGKSDEALKQIDIAHADAPDWPPVYTTEVFVAGNAGDFKRLLAAGKELEALTANSPFSKDTMANALWYSGKHLEAIAEWRAMAEAEHDGPRVLIEDTGMHEYVRGGVRAYALVRLRAIVNKAGTQNHPNDFNSIEWEATAGDKDKAISGLRDLATKRDPDFLENIQSPGLIPLHGDNRFRALLAQSGITINHPY
jgi:DNA-binding winged helix-turn-helix (wHTH) protein/tetratricopeptide (TPR) repeat protein